MQMETPSPRAIARVYGLKYDRLPDYFSLEGLADFIGCSTQALLDAIHRAGTLKATGFKIRRYTTWRIARDDALMFIWGRSSGPSPRNLPHVRHLDPKIVARRLKEAARAEARDRAKEKPSGDRQLTNATG